MLSRLGLCLKCLLPALLVLVLGACVTPRQSLPPAPAPVGGYWFDTFRAARSQLPEADFIAGSARAKITPPPGERMAGHGFNKRSQGILDDLYARVVYLDSGSEAVVLVSLDLIGISLPRVERIRQRITREHGSRIIIAATHNHFGPDTLGFWGPAAFGLLPVRSGIDPRYMDWLEERVALAIRRAVSNARPARLFMGRFLAPEGFAENIRDPEDVPRDVELLRVAGRDGFTIATVVNYACHAEALQDRNRWLTADFPGVMCREVDSALGGVCLFFSGAAGGMIEPLNDPRDPEPKRLAFLKAFGGGLARGVIAQAIGGMVEVPHPGLEVISERFHVPVHADGLLHLAISLSLLEPRSFDAGQVETEMTLVRLGPLRILTIPGEPTPEVGRMLTAGLGGDYRMLVTLGNDELAYILSERQWSHPDFGYERDMSLGPQALGAVVEIASKLSSRMAALSH